jgi:hypothetical protein
MLRSASSMRLLSGEKRMSEHGFETFVVGSDGSTSTKPAVLRNAPVTLLSVATKMALLAVLGPAVATCGGQALGQVSVGLPVSSSQALKYSWRGWNTCSAHTRSPSGANPAVSSSGPNGS